MAFVLEHLHLADGILLPSPPSLRPSVASLVSVGLTSTYVFTLYLSTATRIGSKAASYTRTVTRTRRVRRPRKRAEGEMLGQGRSVSVASAREDDDEFELVDEVETFEVQVPLDKDHPRVVAARLKVASASTAAAVAVTAGLLGKYGAPKAVQSALLRIPIINLFLGLPTPFPTFLNSSLVPLQPPASELLLRHYLPAALLPLGLTMSLFLGPLVSTWLDEELLPGQKNWSWREKVAFKFDNIWGLRNYVVGPLTEELVFRACILSLHHASGASKSALVFATPCYFGVAHLHHAWEAYVQEGRSKDALVRVMLRSAFQFAYTSVFGWYANFIFLRTNSVLAPFICHSFCNMKGLPNPAGAIERHPKRKAVIIASYLAGIATFSFSLWRWTDPSLYGGSVFWQ
ncbi:CAAX prenyl protease [Tilletia horrida]|nr:CAAX prenyl protease [Tilletia horrida]